MVVLLRSGAVDQLTECVASSTFLVVADVWLLVGESVSVVCAGHLWLKAHGSIFKKLLWTPLILLPILGPLAYGGLYEAPEIQPEDLRAKERDMDSER